jgi:hypothetical protein
LQLTAARLCLNCDEVHDAQACPVCVSETFVYLTRWVPRSQPEVRRVVRPIAATAVAQRAVNHGSAFSLMTVALYNCFKRVQTRVELLSLRKAGELR